MLPKRLRLRPVSLRAGSAARATSTNIQYSILNSQFPDKAGFTLRFNPASGISATLRPAKLVRFGVGRLLNYQIMPQFNELYII